MNVECTYIIAYVLNLRNCNEIEGLESEVGILEVMQALEGILEAGSIAVMRASLSFRCVSGSLSFGVLTFKWLD